MPAMAILLSPFPFEWRLSFSNRIRGGCFGGYIPKKMEPTFALKDAYISIKISLTQCEKDQSERLAFLFFHYLEEAYLA